MSRYTDRNRTTIDRRPIDGENSQAIAASKAKLTTATRRGVLEDISNSTAQPAALHDVTKRPATRASARDAPVQEPVIQIPQQEVKLVPQVVVVDHEEEEEEEDDSWNHSALETSGDFHMSPASVVSQQNTITTFQRLTVGEELPRVDDEDLHKPQMVAEYAADIVRIWRHKEGKAQVTNTYMREQQSEINYKMRGILIDWLVEVHLKFKLSNETLFITVQLIDRYLSKVDTQRSKLQLVGITAMLIACKYQEIYPPEVNDFIYISDRAYTKLEILRMEETLLNTLHFNITAPSALSFAKRWLRVSARHDHNTTNDMTEFLLQLTLVDYNTLVFLPSMVATSCCVLGMQFLEPNPNILEVMEHSGYTLVDLEACMSHITELVKTSKTGKLTAVFRKFSSSKFHDVAHIALRAVGAAV